MAEPFPPTKYVPVGSGCMLVDDPATPERETELVIVRVKSGLMAQVRVDACNAEHEVLAGCQAKLVERTSALQAQQQSGMGMGAKIGLVAGGALLIFFLGVVTGAR